MKNPILNSILFIILYFFYSYSFAQHTINSNDTLTNKEHKIEVKKERKIALKASDKRFSLKGSYVFANLNTDMVFGIPDTNGLLSANLSLENNFGLADNKSFFMGTFVYFITPRSGLYAQYYNIKRQNNHTTLREFIFLGQIIPAGTDITSFFDTQVFSLGYLLTIVRDNRVFLGAYFNIFFMDLSSGVFTKENKIDENLEFLLPLPNFGLVANFEIAPWLIFDASVGFFNLKLDNINFAGSIYNVDASLVFKPKDWIGLSLSYSMFDINVSDRYDTENTFIPYSIKYRFNGPALGLSLNF